MIFLVSTVAKAQTPAGIEQGTWAQVRPQLGASGTGFHAKAMGDLPVEVAKLLPSPYLKGGGAYFGVYAAFDGDTLVVGTVDDERGTRAGAAFIFQRDHDGVDAWGLVTRIEASDAAVWDRFGRSVAIRGDTVFVGAPGDDDRGAESGSVYVFERDLGGADQWGQLTKITGYYGSWFGYDLAIDGDTLVVGARFGYGTGDFSGTAYVFSRHQGGTDAWGQVTQIVHDDGDPWGWILPTGLYDYFGSSVAISGETIVIGADGDDDQGESAGSAYVFDRNQGGADNWGQVEKITVSDGKTWDHFGNSVAVSGPTAVVGARYGDGPEGGTGAVYLFDRDWGGQDDWDLAVKLLPPDGAPGDNFGYSVAIEGDEVLVAAYGNEDDGDVEGYGAAYLFRNDGDPGSWVEVKKLRPEGVDGDNCFGAFVGISGDTWVVGDSCDATDGAFSGSVSLYGRDEGGVEQWNRIAKLPAPLSLTARGDEFGTDVSVSGDTLVVGAPLDDAACWDCGSVSVFRLGDDDPSTWILEQILYAPDGTAHDQFGKSVAISGDTLVVGASEDDADGDSSGSAYIFRRIDDNSGTWVESAEISAPDGAAEDCFGYPVAIFDDTVVIGASGDDDHGENSGSAYIFQRNQGGEEAWGQVAKITADDGEERDWFGFSLGISGDSVVIGSPFDDDGGDNSGAAYIFERHQGGVNAWGLLTKVIAVESAEDDRFGYTVAISGNTIVIGALMDDVGYLYDWGSVSVYRRNQSGSSSWDWIATIIPQDDWRGFGSSLAISGDTIVVGDMWHSYSGTAVLYRQHLGGIGKWGYLGTIEAADLWVDEYFGKSVAISGDTIVVGAFLDDDQGAGSGSVYVFEASPRSVERDLVAFER